MKIVKKTLGREEWYSEQERSYCCQLHKDEVFDGTLGLITFVGLPKPEIVTTSDGDLCVAKNGYQWLEVIPRDKQWVLTAMINLEDTIFQCYFDITQKNVIAEDGNADFYDAFLDVVVAGDQDPVIVDRDELEQAYREQIITKEEYEQFMQEGKKIVETFMEKRELIFNKLYEYRELLQNGGFMQ